MGHSGEAAEESRGCAVIVVALGSHRRGRRCRDRARVNPVLSLTEGCAGTAPGDKSRAGDQQQLGCVKVNHAAPGRGGSGCESDGERAPPTSHGGRVDGRTASTVR